MQSGTTQTTETLLTPDQVSSARTEALTIKAGLDRTLFGQEELTRLVLVACLARGHVLLEGLPGLGKTELVKALAQLLGLSFRRLQFTPDLLPGDITGGHILEEDEGRRRLVFHRGPVFTNVLLADEINRASPKTQSALLEAMQERHVPAARGAARPLPVQARCARGRARGAAVDPGRAARGPAARAGAGDRRAAPGAALRHGRPDLPAARRGRLHRAPGGLDASDLGARSRQGQALRAL